MSHNIDYNHHNLLQKILDEQVQTNLLLRRLVELQTEQMDRPGKRRPVKPPSLGEWADSVKQEFEAAHKSDR